MLPWLSSLVLALGLNRFTPWLSSFLPRFSACEVDPHYSTCLKWVISILRSHFFLAPKMSLLWVYFSLPIKQMLPALWGIFCASQSLGLGGLPDARALCRAAHECQGGKRICLSERKGNQSAMSTMGHGVAVASEWKTANKYRTDADKLRLLRKQLAAEERASDWSQTYLLKSQPCCLQPLSTETFASTLNYRFLYCGLRLLCGRNMPLNTGDDRYIY